MHLFRHGAFGNSADGSPTLPGRRRPPTLVARRRVATVDLPDPAQGPLLRLPRPARSHGRSCTMTSTRLLSVLLAATLAASSCSPPPGRPGPETNDRAACAGGRPAPRWPRRSRTPSLGAFEGALVPGAVAAIARADGETQVAAWGLRKAGSDAPMQPGDPVHVGSDTKAMTAVLAARQVDARSPSAGTRPSRRSCPPLAAKVHEGYRGGHPSPSSSATRAARRRTRPTGGPSRVCRCANAASRSPPRP